MAQVYAAGDLKNGVTFEMGTSVFKVVEFQHVKPGKGPAFIRTKLRNVMTGAVIEKTLNPSEKFQAAEIIKEEMQYLYSDGEMYHFMNVDTYEQIQLTEEQLGDTLKYIKESMNVHTLTYNNKVFAVEPPLFVELDVTYTEPGYSGNSSSATTKPATVETGTEVQVPLFIEIGDKIKVDTRTCEYVERLNK